MVADCDSTDEVVSPADELDGQQAGRGRGRSLSPRQSGPRFPLMSPVRGGGRVRSVSPDFANATYAAVQAAMRRRQVQIAELRSKLSCASDQRDRLRQQLEDVMAERQSLRQSVTALTEDKHSL